MKIKDIKRHQDIIAFKDEKNQITAFHASNLEVAEVSEEVFNEMTPIDLNTGSIPALRATLHKEAKEQLNDWNNEINPDLKKGHIEFGIRNITLNVTQICNLHCTYCAAGGDGTYGEAIVKISVEKTLPQLKFFIDALKPGQKFKISYVGGEPLLYPEGILILSQYLQDICKNKNTTCEFSLVTNGTLWNESIENLFSQIPLNLTISIDGPKDINDILRPSKKLNSPTEEILKNLPYFKKYAASIGASAVYSDHRQNAVDIYTFFKQLNLDWYEFNFSTTSIDPDLQKKYLDEMTVLAEKVWDDGKEKELKKIKTFSTYFHFLDSQQQIENFCGAGKSYLAVDANNRIYPCVWEAGDHRLTVGQGDKINRDLVEDLQKPLIVLNNCQTCWARYLCGGGCMYINKVKNGDRHIKNTLFCERTRYLILLTISYYKEARRT